MLAEAIGAVGTDNLATKHDIADLKVEMAKVKAELLKRIIGAIGFQTLVILGAVVTLALLTAK